MIKDDTIDIYSQDFQDHIYEYYEVLRAKGRVVYLSKSNCWVVLGYNDIKQVLEDNTNYSSEPLRNTDTILLGADKEIHSVHKRNLVTNIPCFHKGGADLLNGYSEELITKLYANLLRKKGSHNIVAELINPYSFFMALKALSINSIPAAFDIFSADAIYFDEKIAGINDLFNNWEKLVELVALNLTDEAISPEIRKVMAGIQEHEWKENEELIKFIKMLILAGTETTASLMASSVYFILSDETILPFINDNEIAENIFLNEVLRIYSPVLQTFRKTVNNTVLAGVEIPENSLVAIALAAGNRDPDIFSQPARLSLNRSERQIAFGHGTHRCIGEHLGMYVTKSFIRHFNRVAPDLHYDGIYKERNRLFTFKIAEIRASV